MDVMSDSDKMEAMLKYSRGERKVPVIVEKEGVTIGYRRGS